MRGTRAAVARAYSWAPGIGLAYNYTVLALCHRAVELRGRLRAGALASCAPLASALPGASHQRRTPAWHPAELREATRIAIARRARML